MERKEINTENFSDKIIEDFAKAWINLDARLLTQHLDDTFIYDSQWTYNSLNVRDYIMYIYNKFNLLKSRGIKLNVQIVDDNVVGGKMIQIEQDGNVSFYRIKVKDSKVIKADMCMF